MSIGTLHALTDYEAKLKQWLILFEQPESLPYYDSAPTAQVTIGIGFNISDFGVRSNGFNAMNISASLRAQLTSIINDPAIRNLPPGNDPGERNNELRRQLDLAYGQPFVMSPTEMDVVYAQEITNREAVVTSAVGPSLERIALMSMEWNNLYKDRLITALARGDRAEAWYIIRYGSNADAATSPGNVTRRYAESALFGLYDASVSVSSENDNYTRVLLDHMRRVVTKKVRSGTMVH